MQTKRGTTAVVPLCALWENSDLGQNGVAHGGAAQAGAALAHVVGGAQALVQHLVHRALDGVGLLGHAEGVPQHHGGGEDAGGGVDDVLARDVGGRAVDRLKKAACTLGKSSGSKHTDCA